MNPNKLTREQRDTIRLVRLALRWYAMHAILWRKRGHGGRWRGYERSSGFGLHGGRRYRLDDSGKLRRDLRTLNVLDEITPEYETRGYW